MPADVATALTDSGVQSAYDERPAYQRNDYIGWIERAKILDTRSRRIEQMLDELARGGVYMGMQHAPSHKNGS
jgi:uncharacterized protein YdeI (YjbR/CyaY-like superfamily)